MGRRPRHRLGALHDQHLPPVLALRGERQELLRPGEILYRMNPGAGECRREPGLARVPLQSPGAPLGSGLIGLLFGSSLGLERRQREEELEIGVAEFRGGPAGGADPARRAVRGGRFAQESAREPQGGASLTHAGRPVEQVGMPDMAGGQGGAEKRERFVLAADVVLGHGTRRLTGATREG